MLGALLLIFTLTAARAPRWHELTPAYTFEEYAQDFKKRYSASELPTRRARFKAALGEALAHNAEPRVNYRKGINHLSDATEEELARMRGGRYDPSLSLPHERRYRPAASSLTALKKSVDYRHSVPAVLTAVKDQGFCGDCWAHAVTEAIESSYAMATGRLYVLSQQQVTSCTPKVGGCYSCNGSYPSLGYEYVSYVGLTEEWTYPFESYNASFPACKADPTSNPHYPLQTAVNITGYYRVSPNQATDTMAALQDMGPLSILVDASKWSSYESGIFDGCSYGKNISIDHAVLAVGYGSDNGQDYWIVRNSWSPAWGEAGYIRLAKPSRESCGWNVGAGNAGGCLGLGPAQYWSCGMCGILFAPQAPIVLTG